MALQTVYPAEPARFIVGMIPDMRTPGADRSLVVEPESGIGFGKPVYQGTEDKQCTTDAGGGTVFVGISVLDNTQTDEIYPQYATARVRAEGPVVVTASVAVSAGDLAGVDGDTFIIAADAASAIGTFEVTAEAGALTILDLK